jgi:cytochrome oxidase assembly protein ShyY1
MTVARGRLRAGLAVPVLFVLAAFVTFIALGTWQVERKSWNHLAIADAKGWQERWGAVAPFFIELEAPEPPSGWPRPGALKVNIRNEHLQYAITWYGLAGVLTIMFAFWLRNHRRTA